MKRRLATLILAFICILSFCACSVQSVEQHYAKDDLQDKTDGYAFISIDCRTVLNNYDRLDDSLKSEKYVPKDGVILKKTKYPVNKDDTAFSLLQRAVRDKHIQMEFQGPEQNSLGSVYVQGINYIYEMSCGELSGWLYSVNDDFANVSASEYKIKDGDYVKWQYTCDLGYDLGADVLN